MTLARAVDAAIDQSQIIDFLSSPAAYGADVDTVERIDTHISAIFLAGERVYKLKRAVHFDYIDFSTPALRRAACEAELRVNRRTAPALYLAVRAVSATPDGGMTLDGDGPVLDWLVEMRRFDQAALFDRMAERSALSPALVAAVADAVAGFHAAAERRPDSGGAAGMARVVQGNLSAITGPPDGPFSAAAVDRHRGLARAALTRHKARLEARREAGYVRHCHGDLHLGNICLFDGAPTLFDAIEFNDDLACCDVLYDVAFLVMDLAHRRLGRLANLAFNRYLEATGDLDGLDLFDFFLSCRAAVRAKTTASAALAQSDPAVATRMQGEATAYLDDACGFLVPDAPRLIAVGGLSGCGKSTLAALLAPELGRAPGAVVLRSDVIRKRLFGVDISQPLAAEAYSQAVTREVYGRMAQLAGVALAQGHTVIADAVFARPDERDRIAAVVDGRDVPFTGLWLDAPEAVCARRIDARRGDASDADAAVLRRQLSFDLGVIDWRRLDAAAPHPAVAERARRILAG